MGLCKGFYRSFELQGQGFWHHRIHILRLRNSGVTDSVGVRTFRPGKQFEYIVM